MKANEKRIAAAKKGGSEDIPILSTTQVELQMIDKIKNAITGNNLLSALLTKTTCFSLYVLHKFEYTTF
jgi:hypothetical protein